MFKWLAKKGADSAFKFVQDFLKGIFDKTDLDGDGKLDLKEEVPSLLSDIQAGTSQLIDCVDSSKVARIGALCTELVAEVKSAVNVPRAQEAIEQIRAAVIELLKLGKLALQELQKKEAK